MAKDASALREEAAVATAAGKYKRALAAYLELERIEPSDAQWAKRAGETYRRLGNTKHAIEAFSRSADRYAQNGFLVQAMAVCKLVLQIDPQHAETLRRLSTMNEQVGQGPTRASGMAENNPSLHENPSVAAIRRSTGRYTAIPITPDLRERMPGELAPRPASESRPPGASAPIADGPPPGAGAPIAEVPPPRATSAPDATARPDRASAPIANEPPPGGSAPIAQDPRSSDPIPPRARRSSDPLDRMRSQPSPGGLMSRTKSRPIPLPLGAALDSVNLSEEVPEAYQRDDSSPGIHVIPLDADGLDTADHERLSAPMIEVEDPEAEAAVETEIDEHTELELADIEEIPLPAPRAIGQAARRALAATPLFAGLPSDALEALVENLALVPLEVGEHLFREGDPGDALYVLVEGEVAVQAEGPPRVEIHRLGPGAFLGEVALMTDQPRSATVTALQTSEMLRIDRGTLSRVLANHGDVLRAVLRFVRDRIVERWMRTSPLFRPFDDRQRSELAAKFRFLEIAPGTQLIAAGQRPDGLYIILAGQVTVHYNSRTVATLGAGDLIGETALLSGGTFRSDVTAIGKVLALCLPAALFREVIMTHPHVLEYIGEQAEHSRRLQIL